MDLTPGQRELLQFWGTIEGAVSQNASTADLWAAVHEAANTAGNPLGDVSAADMSVLRGVANGIRQAASNLAAANPGQSLDSTMIAAAPWGRPLDEQAAAPAYQVRFQMTTVEDGEETTSWYTTLFEGGLPATTDLLGEAVAEDAENLAADYGVGFGGVGAMQILSI